jgi:hypothetical protein
MSATQAARLFRHFFDREPEADEIVTVATRNPEDVLVIGELHSVIYLTDDEAKPIIHEFKKTDRPLLCVSSDGRQIYILKGGYEFTDRGFVG